MYLKYIRHKRMGGDVQRGTLYRVQFHPNVRGRYHQRLIPISDVYELALGERLPLTLIYPAGIVQKDGRMRLTFGLPSRQSMLYLIDYPAREAFFMKLQYALHRHQEVRIEIEEEQ